MNCPLTEKRLLPEQMLEDLPEFSQSIQKLVTDIGIDVRDLNPDHIALRINEFDIAKLAHENWKERGDEISSAVINGRPIIVIDLSVKPEIFGRQIECLELPYPAKGKRYPREGWEHVEFVVPSEVTEVGEYLVELKEKFPLLAERWDSFGESGIKTKLSSPKGEGERLSNPTVAFKRDGICVKLHPWTLKAVVESEQR